MSSNKEATVVDLSYFRFLVLSFDFSRRATMLAVLCEEVGRAQFTPNGKGGTKAPSAVDIILASDAGCCTAMVPAPAATTVASTIVVSTAPPPGVLGVLVSPQVSGSGEQRDPEANELGSCWTSPLEELVLAMGPRVLLATPHVIR